MCFFHTVLCSRWNQSSRWKTGIGMRKFIHLIFLMDSPLPVVPWTIWTVVLLIFLHNWLRSTPTQALQWNKQEKHHHSSGFWLQKRGTSFKEYCMPKDNNNFKMRRKAGIQSKFLCYAMMNCQGLMPNRVWELLSDRLFKQISVESQLRNDS